MALENIARLKVNEILGKGVFSADKTISHICDSWEVACVLEGTLNVVAEGNVYKLNNNEIAILSPNRFHSIKGEENCRFFYISFKGEGDFLEGLENKAATLSEKEIFYIKELCQLADSAGDIVYQQFCSLTEFLLLCCLSLEPIKPNVSHKDALLYKRAAEILRDNISKQISVEELAEKLHISLSHLKRVFGRYALTGVHEYYTALKIAEAKKLLLKGISVTETAELTGFANRSYFSAAFKRITDMTPKEFTGSIKTSRPDKATVRPKRQKKESMPSYLL